MSILRAVPIALLALFLPVNISPAGDAVSTGTGQEIRYLIESPYYTKCLAYSPDGKFIAAGHGSEFAFLDATTGKPLKSVKVDIDYITALDYSPDGNFIAYGGDVKYLAIYSVNDGICELISTNDIDISPGFDDIKDIKYSRDGTKLAVASTYNVVLLDTSTREKTKAISYKYGERGNKSVVTSLSFNNDGSKFAVGLRDYVDIWDLKSGKLHRTLDCTGLGATHSASVTTVAFSPDGSKIFTYGFDHTTTMWDVESGSIIWNVITSNPVTPIIQGKYITSTCSVCHSPHSDQGWNSIEVRIPRFVDALGQTAALSTDGKLLATGSKERALIIRDADTGRRIKTFSPYEDAAWRLRSIAFSPDGKQIAVVIEVRLIPPKIIEPNEVELNGVQISTTKLIVYDLDYDGGPEAELRNNILNLTDKRDTKINLAYINKPEQEASEDAARITKEYDALIEKEKAAFEAARKTAATAVEQDSTPDK